MSVTALILPVSGPYNGTWNGFTMGTMNDDGFVLTASYQGQEINASDAWGMTLIEAIFRGVNWRMRVRGLEWNKTGMLASLNAFGSSGAPATSFTPVIGPDLVGNRWSNFCQALSLIAILATPPTTPQIFTALGASPAPQSNIEAMMTSKLREAPMEFVLLPYQATVGSINVQLAFTAA